MVDRLLEAASFLASSSKLLQESCDSARDETKNPEAASPRGAEDSSGFRGAIWCSVDELLVDKSQRFRCQ